MELEEAKAIADKLIEQLTPLCYRCEIAGSIRREKPEVKDIEIVCIPRMVTITEFIDFVNQFPALKGKPIGKYTRRSLPEGIKLDLFMATKENWGLIFAIRTGSAEFSHNVLANGWVKKGFKSKDGILYTSSNTKVFIYEEIDLFNLIGLKFVEPRYRV